MKLRRTLLSSTSVLALLVAADAVAGSAALAADFGGDFRPGLPAVSGLNAKIGAFGATREDDAAGGALLGLAFPLWWGFGAQIDGVVGDSMAAPSTAWAATCSGAIRRAACSAPMAASVESGSGAFDIGGEVGKAGLEAQLYLGRLSLEGLSAYQYGSTEGFAGKGTVAYYPHDDFRIHLGVSHLQGPGLAGYAGLEWAPLARRGLSLFADIGVDEDRDLRSLFGLKFYLSRSDKTLIRRHREDDPDVDLPGDLYQALQARGVCPAGKTLINGFCDGNV